MQQSSIQTPSVALCHVLEVVRSIYAVCAAAVIPVCAPAGEACTESHHGVPCTRTGKRPLISGYPNFAVNLPPVEMLVEWVRRFFPCNLALVIPAHLLVVEADSPAAAEELRRLGGAALDRVPARGARPGRGPGFLFRSPPVPLLRSVRLGVSKAIDVLTVGGIFIIPPSVHTTGHVYRWLRAPWETGIEVVPQAIIDLVASSRTHLDATAKSGLMLDGSAVPPGLPGRVRYLITNDREVRDLWNGKKERGDTSASGVDFTLAQVLTRKGIRPNDVTAAVVARPGAHRHDVGYGIKTVAAASAVAMGRNK